MSNKYILSAKLLFLLIPGVSDASMVVRATLDWSSFRISGLSERDIVSPLYTEVYSFAGSNKELHHDMGWDTSSVAEGLSRGGVASSIANPDMLSSTITQSRSGLVLKAGVRRTGVVSFQDSAAQPEAFSIDYVLSYESDGEAYEPAAGFMSGAAAVSISVWKGPGGSRWPDFLVANQVVILSDSPPPTGGAPVFREERGTLFVAPGSAWGKGGQYTFSVETTAVPIPTAVWLFGSGLAGLLGLRRIVADFKAEQSQQLDEPRSINGILP